MSRVIAQQKCQTRNFFTVVYPHERVLHTRLGSFKQTMQPGLNFYIPLVDSYYRVDVRTVTTSLPTQEIISRDNVSYHVDAEMQWKIVDPYKSFFNVENVKSDVPIRGQLALRDVMSSLDVDQFLQERDTVSNMVTHQLKDLEEEWGVQVSLVQVRNIVFDSNMKRAMARKAEATRTAEAKFINAEADVKTSEKYAEAAKNYQNDPITLRLREFDLWQGVSREKNNTIYVVPTNLMDMFGSSSSSKK